MSKPCLCCLGFGSEPTTEAELTEWLTKARAVYRDRLNASKKATGAAKAAIEAELVVLSEKGKAAREALQKLQAAKPTPKPVPMVAKPASGLARRPANVVAVIQSYTSDKVYQIRQAADETHLYCDCPAWKYQRLPPRQRTCKHIQAFEADQKRQLQAGAKPKQLAFGL